MEACQGIRRSCGWLALGLLGLATPAHPQPITLQPIATGLVAPTSIVAPRDGSSRLFIVQQNGQIRIHDGLALLPQPFLDISSLVSNSGERGLLGLAFHPAFATNGYFFVDYTDPDDATGHFNVVIARYRVSATDPNQADPASATTILKIPKPYANHNGGQLQFGADGYLYIGVGDGGSGGDPQNHAQDLSTVLGKVLRIDVTPTGPAPYGIPSSNPFVSTPGARGEIWAYGLRNPWRFSFDRTTHDLLIADVGQDRIEEIDFQPASSTGGENYGWRLMEGTLCYNPATNCNPGGLVLPILEYDHSQGCAVIGGYRYRGQRFPQLRGTYLYGDYCSGRLWGGRQGVGGAWTTSEMLKGPYSFSTFGEDEKGEVYVAHYGGTVFRIIMTDVDPMGDYDGDAKTDLAVYHPPTGIWYVKPSSGAATYSLGFGGAGYQPLRGDFDGDGKADVAVYHAATGLWFIQQSSTGTTFSLGYGGPGYTPVPGDYDGDGKTDIAVYHPASGLWFVRQSSTGTTVTVGFGGSGFVPVRGDFDGDGRTDIAVYHAATGLWFIRQSSTGTTFSLGYGGPGYTPVPGDFDGDGKTDIAVYHAATGLWFMRQSSSGATVTLGFGGSNYLPVRGDFDGDGKTDVAVYHSPTGLWFIRPSSTGVTYSVPFGTSEFVPVN
jgi:glucose/arabinose dehydrogenase